MAKEGDAKSVAGSNLAKTGLFIKPELQGKNPVMELSEGLVDTENRERNTKQVKPPSCSGNGVCGHLAGARRFSLCGLQPVLPGPGRPVIGTMLASNQGLEVFPKQLKSETE